MDQTRHLLRAGTLVAEVRPDYGGRITRFHRETDGYRQDFFRPTPAAPGDVRTPFKTGCYPLVPFSNRIDHGRFSFQGRTFVLPPHPGAAPHAMHGHGAVAVWTVAERTGNFIRIEYRHTPDSWPFAYRAVQDIALDEAGLAVAIQVSNLSAATMPVGLGLHPFFDHSPGTILSFRAGGHWLATPDFLPYARAGIPAELDFATGRELGEDQRDHSFDAWDGHALIRWPDRSEALEIRADASLTHLILHRPTGLPYFCLEPVSHVTNAFNLAAAGYPGTGMRSLAPGETLRAVCRFMPVE